MEFFKYQGTGNDFVIIDNRKGIFDIKDVKTVNFLCNRRFGVGADGLMLLEESPKEGVDFYMRYYNSDGGEASMCGNGGRCIAAFAVKLGVVSDPTDFVFDAVDGLHKASYNDGIVSLRMVDVESYRIEEDFCFLDTGSPHYVKHVDSLDGFSIVDFGKKIRYSEAFAPDGTNVNVVEQIADNNIRLRTYERGVEDETLSCGTGSVASVLANYLLNKKCTNYTVNVEGGKLNVNFEPRELGFKNIWLSGPATFVFKGNIDL